MTLGSVTLKLVHANLILQVEPAIVFLFHDFKMLWRFPLLSSRLILLFNDAKIRLLFAIGAI